MGKFIVNKTNPGFVFHLMANNGEIIAISGVYLTEYSCLKCIESVRKNAPIASCEDLTVQHVIPVRNPRFRIYSDKADEYSFCLKAANGLIIAVSEGYTSKKSCTDGIESVKKNAVEANVEKNY